jgi:tetratricopeptide (TPR) repeat protein
MCQSRFEDAWRIGEESLASYEQLGERRGVAMALHNLATLEWALGRGDHGRARFEQALGMLHELGDSVTEALCLPALASALLRVGEPALAQARLREAFALLTRLEMPREAVFAFEGLAEWLLATGQPGDAARLLGAASKAREVVNLPMMPHEAAEALALATRSRAAIGDAEWARQEAAGRQLSLADAVAAGSALVNEVRLGETSTAPRVARG